MLLPLFLNRSLLLLPITTRGQTALRIQKEITHFNEMDDQIFNIGIDMDMIMWDIPRNVTESISFHRFHGQNTSTISD
jgi:hypothetical protein